MSAATTSDTEKLLQAFGDLSKLFHSWDDMLEAFGLLHMPVAQRYGILFGCITFTCTLVTVACLLTFGGSFTRIAEQQENGEATIPHAHQARVQRALLLERLLDARERMLQNYPSVAMVAQGDWSPLTRMLLNVQPKIVPNAEKKEDDDDTPVVKKEYPPDYQNNYAIAYRKCQDSPGGNPLGGRPEAHFEAYARGFAGCGSYTSLAYRRSYARLYEAIACDNHGTDDKFSDLFETRPQDIIGKTVRLEAVDEDRHLNHVFELTSGDADTTSPSYNPSEVWGFLEDGPFVNKEQMRQSFVFQRKMDEAAFAIVNNLTDRIVGMVLLKNDNPQNLGIQLEAPIMRPNMDGTSDQTEACFLLLDKLFALGYRRVQMACDSHDGYVRKLAVRLGFTLEGTMFKHMILKDASRDSNIYGLLNSDWDQGARFALYKKLHGAKSARQDQQMRKRGDEEDEKAKVLAEKEAAEAAVKDKNL